MPKIVQIVLRARLVARNVVWGGGSSAEGTRMEAPKASTGCSLGGVIPLPNGGWA